MGEAELLSEAANVVPLGLLVDREAEELVQDPNDVLLHEIAVGVDTGRVLVGRYVGEVVEVFHPGLDLLHGAVASGEAHGESKGGGRGYGWLLEVAVGGLC